MNDQEQAFDIIKTSFAFIDIFNVSVLESLSTQLFSDQEVDKLKILYNDPDLKITKDTLEFGLNRKVNYFPNGIKGITFGNDFNQDVRATIPNTVTHLTFGNNFNQNIRCAIPNSVTHLTFGNSFNQDIKGAIPNSVTHLTFGNSFNQDIKGAIPRSVIELKINDMIIKDLAQFYVIN